MVGSKKKRVLFFVTVDWFFCSHWLPMAEGALEAGYEILVAARVTKYQEEIESKGIRVIPLQIKRRNAGLLGELSALLEVYRIYKKEKPDIVHQIALKPILFGSLCARLVGIPVVVNAVVGLGYVFTSSHLLAGLIRWPMKVALSLILNFPHTQVFVENKEVPAQLNKMFAVPRNRITLIPGAGVDIKKFHYTKEPKGKVKVVMISRMLWDKGIRELVEASRVMYKNKVPVDIILIGKIDAGNPSSLSVKCLQEWEAEGILQWWGEKKDIAQILENSHIAVLPSHNEGLPKSLIEAASCGRPIITTDIPGCRAVVVNEENGLIVPLKDPDALRSAIVRLVGDVSLRRRFGEAGRKRAENLFSEEKVVERVLTAYSVFLGTPL